MHIAGRRAGTGGSRRSGAKDIKRRTGSVVSLLLWLAGLASSIAVLAVVASKHLYYVHMGLAALIAIAIALAALAEVRSVVAARASPSVSAAVSLRQMALVWLWAAASMLVTYTLVLSWREWWQFVIVFAILALISWFLSRSLEKDDTAGAADVTMLKIARVFAITVLVAMFIVVVGLLVDGKMWRFLTAAGRRVGWQDWGANNVFFFGAMAVAAIAWNVVSTLKDESPR
jgi:hypothetical protein